MILVISICEEKLHENEFVSPVTDLLIERGFLFLQKHYLHVTQHDVDSCSKVIICGTSLQDNSYKDNLEAFTWLRFFSKPVLGICAGIQILGLVYGGTLKKKTEIGYFFEHFEKNFLGLKGKQEVYHLHNYYVDFSVLDEFVMYTKGKVSQAVKHKSKPLYGVLFHPEVRNKVMIENFVNL